MLYSRPLFGPWSCKKEHKRKKKKKKMAMRQQSVFILFSVLLLFLSSSVFIREAAGADSSLTEECSQDFQSVSACLNYATGKVDTPTKDCCTAVKTIKDSKPKCLCFILQQTHNGSAEIRSMGIQEAKLFQLPTACQLQNASVSYCPKLLGLSPNSPDAAIFTNNNSSTTAPVSSAGTGTSAPEKIDSASGTLSVTFLAPLVIAVVIFLFSTFPAGPASMFYT